MLTSPDKIHPVDIGVVEMFTSVVYMLTSKDYIHPVDIGLEKMFTSAV
jgi:hypothetical protein